MVAGVVAAVAVAAVAVPLTTGWVGDADSLPAEHQWVGPDGEVWSPELPGLDLPLGEPLSVPYTQWGAFVVSDSTELELDSISPLASFLTVPGGVVLGTGEVNVGADMFSTGLELFRADGSHEIVDSGVITGATAARQADGSVLLVYGWLSSPTAEVGEVRTRELGSDVRPRRFPVDGAPIVRSAQPTAQVATEVMINFLTDPGRDPAMVDLETGDVTSVPPAGVDVFGTTPGGLTVGFDVDRQCTVAEAVDGSEAWSVCDGYEYVGLSPDGAAYVTYTASYDSETGEQLATLPLPGNVDPLEGPVTVRQGLMGWETADAVLFAVSVEPEAEQGDGAVFGFDTYVVVRCSVTSGSCERVPHPVDMVGTFAR